MSQVILKLAKGDKLESNENFVIWGPRQYKYSDFENSVINNNFDSYLQEQGIKGNDANEIKNYLNAYLEGFKSGKIKRNIDGTYNISDESLITDDNPVKRNFFGKIKGDKKRIALAYFDDVFNSLNPYKKEEEGKEKFTFGYGKQLNRDIFKDDNESEAERKIWDESQNKWDVALNALNKYKESLTGNYDFSDTSFKDLNEYISSLNGLEESIKSKDLNAFKQALYNIGEADIYDKLFITRQQQIENALTPEQKEKIEKENKEKEITARLTELENAQKNPKLAELANFTLPKNEKTVFSIPNIDGTVREKYTVPESKITIPFNPNIDSSLFLNYNPENVTEFTNKLNNYLANPDNVYENDYIKNSITTRLGFPTIWKWDRVNNKLQELLLKQVDQDLYNKWLQSTLKKDGGIIKAQNGHDLNVEFGKKYKTSKPVVNTTVNKETPKPSKQKEVVDNN